MDNVASASDFLSRFLPGSIPSSGVCTNTPVVQQRNVSVTVEGNGVGDISPVADAIREAIRQAYGFDPGESLSQQATIRIIQQIQGRHVSTQAVASLVQDVTRFIPDPRSFPDATDYFLERIQDRRRWNRMYMGIGPRADATMSILDMLHDAAFLPRKE
ncbi:MAG: hypothetical protein ACYCPA_00570 [Acidithiobacillus sp.]